MKINKNHLKKPVYLEEEYTSNSGQNSKALINSKRRSNFIGDSSFEQATGSLSTMKQNSISNSAMKPPNTRVSKKLNSNNLNLIK